MSYSPHQSNPNQRLINLATHAINYAFNNTVKTPLKDLPDSQYMNIYPGEHYRLLKAIMAIEEPKNVVEIGTFTGMGVVAMFEDRPNSKITTFDLKFWHEFATHLDKSYFHSLRVHQSLADLSDPEMFIKYYEILNEADFIFMDGPKDGVFEYKMMELFKKLTSKEGRILMIDDIWFDNMVPLWRAIQHPKVDMTSFGHWSGTGLVDISDSSSVF